MMKRVLIAVIAVALLFSFSGCKGDENANSTTTATTTVNVEDANKKTLAKLGLEELIVYLNVCASYGQPLNVENDDTISDILTKFRQNGAVVEVSNINESAKFFDYAVENPDNKDGSELYIAKEEADWFSLYVD